MKSKPAPEVETPKDEKPRMHTIVFKEKDKEGKQFFVDVDTIMPPVFMFGEGYPILMATVDDKAFFIPLENVHHFEQNYGVAADTKHAETLASEYKKSKQNKNDVSIC